MWKKLFDETLWKYLLVGVLNTIVGCGLMFLLYNVFGCSYWVSSVSNYVVGSTMSFFLNKRFTFKNRERGLLPVLKFIITILLCYLIAYGVAKPLVRSVLSRYSTAIQENVAMLVGMCLYVGLNYLAQRFFVFRSAEKEMK